MVSCVGVHSPNIGCTWPSTKPGMTAPPAASSTLSAFVVSPGRSRAAILPSAIRMLFTGAVGRVISPVKNSPMFLIKMVIGVRSSRVRLCPRSLRLDARRFDDGGPTRNLGLDQGGKLRRRGGVGLEAKRDQPL